MSNQQRRRDQEICQYTDPRSKSIVKINKLTKEEYESKLRENEY